MHAAATALLIAVCCNLVATSLAAFSWQQVTNQAVLQTGDGTFYGAGQDSQGTCSFSANFANTNDLPWSTGAKLTLALNDNQFDNSAACGLCIMYRGTGAGLGTTPIPSTWTLGFVNNRCPECQNGDLDQATSGDGRWKVQWYGVPCSVGDSSLVYSIVVSSYYWFSLVVSNTRTPITGVSVKIGGTWLALPRTNNNQWPYYNTNGPWQSSFPLPIQITNVLGETITDTITGPSGNSGTVQFSADGSGSGMPATAAGNATATPPAASGPAYPGTLSQSPPATPPAAPPTASQPPPATPPAVATPPAGPPPSQSPPAPLASANGFYIENYQQCGGSGGACNDKPYTAAPCQDIAWPEATCRSTGFQCTRYDSTLWSCIPNANITYPPPMAYSVPPAAPPTQQATSTTTPPTPAMPVLTPPPQSSNTALQSSGPIQSLAGSPPPASPPPAGTSPPPAASTPPPTSSSPPPAASPPPAGSSPPPASSTPPPTPSPPTPTSTYSFAISEGGQCGGTTQCAPPGTPTDKVTCNNGPWAGAYCSNGYTCQADPGPLIWSCKPPSVATGGRRLLTLS